MVASILAFWLPHPQQIPNPATFSADLQVRSAVRSPHIVGLDEHQQFSQSPSTQLSVHSLSNPSHTNSLSYHCFTLNPSLTMEITKYNVEPRIPDLSHPHKLSSMRSRHHGIRPINRSWYFRCAQSDYKTSNHNVAVSYEPSETV